MNCILFMESSSQYERVHNCQYILCSLYLPIWANLIMISFISVNKIGSQVNINDLYIYLYVTLICLSVLKSLRLWLVFRLIISHFQGCQGFLSVNSMASFSTILSSFLHFFALSWSQKDSLVTVLGFQCCITPLERFHKYCLFSSRLSPSSNDSIENPWLLYQFGRALD